MAWKVIVTVTMCNYGRKTYWLPFNKRLCGKRNIAVFSAPEPFAILGKHPVALTLMLAWEVIRRNWIKRLTFIVGRWKIVFFSVSVMKILLSDFVVCILFIHLFMYFFLFLSGGTFKLLEYKSILFFGHFVWQEKKM